MTPLYKLLRKNMNFSWSSECQKAYETMKREISSDNVLVHFDPSKPIVLTTDASNTAIAGICHMIFMTVRVDQLLSFPVP